ncbi:hypothetical protein HJC23_005000 [Cyclotella cryptica]|uniref:ABC1 atypical kinase-like domain-containing protein n=1 Tax=Cyclotella cryptica TaxID=29204 RepID=A0ABD3QE20_9STRA|eukprot:CCRYP_006223-RA/>CCRYP_006223-RA protein AED:0.29 eAED:0.29 QI:231/1/1/1/1/1/2/200/620
MSGWSRVANGLRIVATDGASRIAHALVSADPQSVASSVARHVPEVASSIVLRAGGTKLAHFDVNKVGGGKFTTKEGSFVTGKNGGPSESSRSQMNSSYGHRETGLNCGNERVSGDSEINENNGDSITPQIQHVASAPRESSVSSTKESNTFSSFENQIDNYDEDHENQHLPEGSAVPSSRIARALGFASLGAGLAMGTVAELARRSLGNPISNKSDPLVLSNDANAQRLSNSLRRMRGAAMKLGQMLSIQDESIAPPALTNALAQVRKGAEAMPTHQLMRQLDGQWGEGWKDRIDLEERPFAAASIGQVHRGTLRSPSSLGVPTKVAVKVQYPGVADSIESDLSNLSMLVKATGLAPPGLFLDNVIRVGRDELKVECDYLREMKNHKRFLQLISSDPILVAERFAVPRVVEELCTDKILVTEYVRGGTIDKVVDLDQSERNRIGRAILRLTMLELFVWRFMQTDPNWGNFLYDVRTRTTYLIDFGAAREYDEEFVRGYLNIVVANANRDEATLMEESIRMGFLTGAENEIMLEAHKLSGFCLGEPFQSYEPYDFKTSRITSRISEHGSVFLKHRLTPPPEEVYTLHRKLAGAYNLCIKLGSIVSCRDLLDEVSSTFNSKT